MKKGIRSKNQMSKKLRKPSEALYPTPVVMVTCVDKEGKPNIITLAWVGIVCSGPPMIGIAIRPSRYSHKLISESEEFVVNIPTVDLAEETDYCGMVSGRDTDKFKGTGLHAEPSSKIESPLIEECPMNIECKVRQVISLGAHDLFIGEVMAVHVDETVLDEKGRIDYSLAKPFVFNQGEYWSLGEIIGSYGYSKR